MKKFLQVAVLASIFATASHALTILETESVWTGTFYSNTSSGSIPWNIGQSFQVPLSGDTIFDKGRLNVRTLAGRTVSIGIATYNPGTSIAGPFIGTQNVNVIGNGLWQAVEYDPANIALTPGGFYALIMTATLVPVSIDVAAVPGTSYVPGRYLTGSTVPGTMANFPSDDTSFRIELVAVPEPATMTALAIGIASVAAKRRSKKRI